ncbi:MAG TPA: hypothetical protein VFY73_22005 [Ideonella sp.]|uniref:hypothetical protein n=1 Tax=Ideonella sp. TaxID=1929293 RepID=UPI002E362946|nr:hypothetical protein [Ideonella sp.]HEX5686691.1 hypothetical protein [Ideonella sp.]
MPTLTDLLPDRHDAAAEIVSEAPEPREATVAAVLREALAPLLDALAGQPPRPVRLMRRIGLDKSLASRLVQAVRAESDSQFLHLLPSPTGLRILIERSRNEPAAADWLPAVERAVDAFAALLDALPGGRQALDARLGEDLSSIRERREHMARQASFKAVSFLFGHYCETLSTALFLFPSAAGRWVDAVEVHRRLGLRRITPGTALPLLSLHAPSGPAPAVERARRLTPIDGVSADTQTAADAQRFFIAEGCSLPLPALDVEQEGGSSTFLLGAQSPDPLPARLTTALRITNVQPLQPDAPYLTVRNYMLHTPCQRLVREIYLADGLWPDALPHIGFYLPGPSGIALPPPPPGVPHYRRLHLSAPIEQLPAGPAISPLTGVADHASVLGAVLRRAGLGELHFRGWRCQTPYPVPLVEMQLGFRFAGHREGAAGGPS